ncbi:MAG: sigma-54 dependent transcriptional regulator [Alphaproteobacteria bacterium]|nr:sigma-54 dependent transcriptional regulator [Alphaproteobacteria bacterium]
MQSLKSCRIAVIEDDPIMGESLVQRLSLEKHAPIWWQTGGEALAGLSAERPDLVICDIRLPDMNGEELFQRARARLRDVPVLFMTAYGEIPQAVRLIREGADDYITKPFDLPEFLARIDRLLEQHDALHPGEDAVLGTSAPMRRIETLLRRVGDIDSNLLFTGESGVGKEVAARFVHRISPRAVKPFMAVNCAAIPPELIDSELFGHERGAFTSATSRHEGYAERARDGVLFLDEVAELPPAVQAKLLRLVQERVFFRVGGERPVEFRARLFCATNADLDARVRDGRFREDLYYRVNVIPVAIPPLRQRQEDIPGLARRFLDEFCDLFGRDVRGFTLAAREAMRTHAWTGNVRELRNRIERAVALSDASLVDAPALFPEAVPGNAAAPAGAESMSLAEARDEAERRHILSALERTGGQVGKAAELLSISRTTLWEKMRRLGLNPEGEA